MAVGQWEVWFCDPSKLPVELVESIWGPSFREGAYAPDPIAVYTTWLWARYDSGGLSSLMATWEGGFESPTSGRKGNWVLWSQRSNRMDAKQKKGPRPVRADHARDAQTSPRAVTSPETVR